MDIRVLLLTVVLFFGVGATALAQDKKPVKTDKETVVFDVSMTCESCKNRIEKNIAFENGVTDMKIDLPKKTVQVEFKKDKTSVAKLKGAIEKLGYEVKVHDGK